MAIPVAVSRVSPSLTARAMPKSVTIGSPAVGVDQDVVGLDVAMDDAALMGVSERIRDVAHDSSRLVDRERAVLVQQLRDIVARDVRHHEENDAALLVDRVDVDDVRVVELRGHLGLAQEPGLDFAAERQFGWQYFDGDRALQTPIFGAIDDPHAAAPDLAVQLIMGTERALDERAQLCIRLRRNGLGQAISSL